MNGRKNIGIRLAVCMLVPALSVAVPAVGDTHYVNPGQSIQAAIYASSDGDEIEVSPGTYYEAIIFRGKALRLYSKNGRDVTTINGDGEAHVVACINGEWTNTILEGFTITGGGGLFMFNDGGGMYNLGSSPTVRDCTFRNNEASYSGGGMYNENSSPTVTNCIFSSNKTTGDRVPVGGGGMYNKGSSPTLINCSFLYNSTVSRGGGIRNSDNSNPIIINCCFFKNDTLPNGRGGGMYNENSYVWLINCTFRENNAGWAIHYYTYGGGLSVEGGNTAIYNCIFWGNFATQGPQIHNHEGLVSVNYSDIQGGWSGTGNINADPLFRDEYVRLLGRSPCIDAGLNDAVPAYIMTDLDGNPRIADGDGNGAAVVDMGAYERHSTIYVPLDYATIQGAIDAAVPGDGIEVAPGTYNEAINFKGKAIRLYSNSGPYVTTIDGTGKGYHVVQCVNHEDSRTVLEGFTITGGNANGTSWPDNCGGGMYNERSSPTVKNCVFTGNNAVLHGGGMYSHVYNETTGGSPTVINCIFQSNTAVHGAGMTNHHYVDTEVTDCKFSGNTSEYGGGMYNTAFSGPKLINCTFSNNSAQSLGGGILNYDNSSPTVTNCTFSNNEAFSGGGIYNLINSSPTVTNCILWGDSISEIFDDGTSSSTVNYSDINGGWAGLGNIDTDPCFVDTNNPDPNLWNLRLQQNSPCIDVGNNSTLNLSDFDLDGHPRIIDGDCNDVNVVDMGAYEFNYAYMGDLDHNCRVDFFDYSIFSRAWETKAGDPNWDWACDMSDPPDDHIDWRDVAILCDNWLAQIP